MNNSKNDRCSLIGLWVLGAAMLVAQGCSSGSGGSDVGKQSNIPPVARPEILNGNGGNTFREGSEVLLSGKASEDKDGPVLAWTWKQVSGPSVELIQRNTNTVSFTAPHVDAATKLSFQLTVEDSSLANSPNAAIDVNVIPARDSDKFLSLDVRSGLPRHDTFDTFNVVAALADGATTGTTAKPFALSVLAYVVYPPRSADDADCTVDTTAFAASVPTTTTDGCLVKLLQDLTPTPAGAPAGSVGLQGQWPANVTVVTPAGLTPAAIEAMRVSEWWNPHFELKVPRLDVADFDQQFVDANQRSSLLDQFNAYKARIVLKFSLVAPSNQGDATIILTNATDQPVALPASAPHVVGPTIATIIPNSGAGLPTGAAVPLETVFASIPGRESALTSEIYYRTVDPTNTRTTLNAWLKQAGFTDTNGKLLPAVEAGTGEFAHAVYLNNYDLGFGRDMHARRDANGNVYSYVVNYTTLEGAIRKVAPIVTVVMEYSPLAAPTDPNKFVKFFTYVDDGSGDARRVSSMNFDGRGERYTAGNCVACHGGAKPPGIEKFTFDAGCGDRTSAACYTWPTTNDDNIDISNGNLQSTFLPWDLDSFYFADTDPAITKAPVPFDGVTLQQDLKTEFGDFSRSAQEAQLKKLNQFSYSTYCNAATTQGCQTDGARKLVEYWYKGVDSSGNLTAATYEDAHAPPGWMNNEVVATPTAQDPNLTGTNPATAEDLYHNVFARHCRMCHTNAFDDTVRFDNYQKLKALFTPQVIETVFNSGRMPASRLTMDRFWTVGSGGSSPAQLLANHIGLAPAAASGPAPAARIADPPSPVVPRNSSVRLSASDSLFANSYAWTVAYVPAPQLAGGTTVAGYAPQFVGDGTSDVSFVPQQPGTYTASLVINSAGASPPAALTSSKTVSVDDYVPLACGPAGDSVDRGSTTPGGATVNIPFLQTDRFVPFVAGGSSATCASTTGFVTVSNSPDLPLTYTLTPAFDATGHLATANGGTFTLTPNTPCTLANPAGCSDDVLSYVPKSSGGSYVDTVSYTITDADGETSTGSVEITVTQSLSTAITPFSNPLSESAVALAFTVSGGALANPRYTVKLTSGPSRGVVRRNGSALSVGDSFTTNGAPSDLQFSYTSNAFQTGSESLTFTVTDTAASSKTAAFSFTVLPQAPFATSVMAQWASTSGGKVDCRTCHADTNNSTALNRFDLTQSATSVYNQLVNGTVGSVKVNVGTPDSSLILCYPSGQCGTGHSGGSNALPSSSPSYAVIKRWIQEGAHNN